MNGQPSEGLLGDKRRVDSKTTDEKSVDVGEGFRSDNLDTRRLFSVCMCWRTVSLSPAKPCRPLGDLPTNARDGHVETGDGAAVESYHDF
ncbi:MAG: hypothetical protein Q8Q12_00080 [bacterium]|nr:hypothetical protein [bacterium]